MVVRIAGRTSKQVGKGRMDENLMTCTGGSLALAAVRKVTWGGSIKRACSDGGLG